MSHEAVMAAVVIGIPDPVAIHLSRAYVMLTRGTHVSEDELIQYVADRLPVDKHLTGGVRFLDEIPLNRSSKPDRMKLKQMTLAEETLKHDSN
jgi:acyl-coenzyme A synthetase/AMP-(fatty) acid ligase